jgi:hypothetical protein
MNITICGIPAIASVTYFERGCAAIYSADPDDSYPAEPAVIGFKVLDRAGRPAPWLEAKMSDEEVQRIEAELLCGLM